MRNCVMSWCGCGGCVGSGRERLPQGRSRALAMWRIWCNGWSATGWMRTGTGRIGEVARVLRQTVRASSAVECMNSVLRMHQSRHRTVTQGLLDLKRLYWNCRAFREGKRRGRCPYEHLGLKLPGYEFWGVLQMPTRRGRLIPRSVKFQTYALGRSPRVTRPVNKNRDSSPITTTVPGFDTKKPMLRSLVTLSYSLGIQRV